MNQDIVGQSTGLFNAYVVPLPDSILNYSTNAYRRQETERRTRYSIDPIHSKETYKWDFWIQYLGPWAARTIIP